MYRLEKILLGAVIFLASAQAHTQELVWAKQLGGATDDLGGAMALDAAGNVYTVGYFTTTADFDPGPDTLELAVPVLGLYVTKLDRDGHLVWARPLAGSAFAEALGVAVDAAGNVYIVGYFGGTFDFDP